MSSKWPLQAILSEAKYDSNPKNGNKIVYFILCKKSQC